MRRVHPLWSHAEVLAYFEARPGDVLETELLRHFFPDEDHFDHGISLELFEKHFLLYRRLWLFDDELRQTSGQRLWIRGIRSTLLAPPPQQRCPTLDPDTGRYCLAEVPCARHNGPHPAPLSLKSYYLDDSNLHVMNQQRLTELVEGFFQWMVDPGAQTRALQVLGLTEDATPAETRARWKALSKKNHPDRGGDVQVFQQLSAAWEVLKPKVR